MIKEKINFLYRFGLRVKDKIFREIYSAVGLRPDSYPYITGDGFRKLCDHIYDETGKCKATDIKEGQLVFVKSDYIPEWFSTVHPNVSNRYKLLNHNSDYNIKEPDLSYIDDKIIHWYAQNVLVKHPKLTPIPIGFNNRYLFHLSSTRFYDKYVKYKVGQANRIIFGFSIHTNPKERQPAYDYLINSKIADKIRGKNYPKTYAELIKKYKFIAAPNGNGLDDPRRWQALYFGIVPIVTKSEAMVYFKSLGLPLYIIEDWHELDDFTEEDLNRVFNDLMAKKNDDPLYFDYWKKLILQDE